MTQSVDFNDILYVLITVALPLLLRFVYQIVSVKVADTKFASAVKSVFSAVEYVSQTYVDSLKQSGDFDAEAQRLALAKAKDAALETMESGVRKWLEKSFDDVDLWLTVQIESAVKASKEMV